jgi:hypothetical protein
MNDIFAFADLPAWFASPERRARAAAIVARCGDDVAAGQRLAAAFTPTLESEGLDPEPIDWTATARTFRDATVAHLRAALATRRPSRPRRADYR